MLAMLEPVRVASKTPAAIAINPNQARYYKNRGRAYAQLKQYRSAVEDFTAAMRIMPNDSELLALRGLAYSLMNAKTNALSDYQMSCAMGKQEACNAFIKQDK